MSYLVDVNILVYAHDRNSRDHEVARQWFHARMNGLPQTVGIPWQTILGFLRVVTNPRIYDPPESAAQAWDRVEQWMQWPACWIPEPGSRHQVRLGELVTRNGVQGNLVTDAHLVTLAQEHGLAVASADTDFAKFPDVKWVNPVAPAKAG